MHAPWRADSAHLITECQFHLKLYLLIQILPIISFCRNLLVAGLFHGIAERLDSGLPVFYGSQAFI